MLTFFTVKHPALLTENYNKKYALKRIGTIHFSFPPQNYRLILYEKQFWVFKKVDLTIDFVCGI